MCEDCRDEIGPEMYDRIAAFCDEWPDAEFGPAHIVLSDTNVEVGHIEWCLGLIVGERQRRGDACEPQSDGERRGVLELAGGDLGGDPAFYKESDHDELIATEQFLRDVLLPWSKDRERIEA